jgi:hypothetical protein
LFKHVIEDRRIYINLIVSYLMLELIAEMTVEALVKGASKRIGERLSIYEKGDEKHYSSVDSDLQTPTSPMTPYSPGTADSWDSRGSDSGW